MDFYLPILCRPIAVITFKKIFWKFLGFALLDFIWDAHLFWYGQWCEKRVEKSNKYWLAHHVPMTLSSLFTYIWFLIAYRFIHKQKLS